MSEEKAVLLRYYKDECCKAYTQYKKSEELYKAHRNEWTYWRERFEDLDRELALTDGRLHTCPLGKKTKEPTKAPEFTKEQLLAIAEKLGIEIREIEPNLDGWVEEEEQDDI